MLTTDKLKTVKKDRQSAIVFTKETVYKYVEDLAHGIDYFSILIEMGFGQQIVEGLISQPALLLQQSTNLARHADTATIRSYLAAAKKAARYLNGTGSFSIDDLLIIWKRPPLRWSIYESVRFWTEKEREKLVERLQGHPENHEFLDYYLSLFKEEGELTICDVELIDDLKNQEKTRRQIIEAERENPIPFNLNGLFEDQTESWKPPTKLDQVSDRSAIKRIASKYVAKLPGLASLLEEEPTPIEKQLHRICVINHPKGAINLITPIFIAQVGNSFTFEDQTLEYGKFKSSELDVHGALSNLIDGLFFQDLLDETNEKIETRRRWLQLLRWNKRSIPKPNEYRRFVSNLMKPPEPTPEAPKEYLIPDDIFESNSEITEQITEQEIVQ